MQWISEVSSLTEKAALVRMVTPRGVDGDKRLFEGGDHSHNAGTRVRPPKQYCRSSKRPFLKRESVLQLPAQRDQLHSIIKWWVGCLFWINRHGENTKKRFCSSMILSSRWLFSRTHPKTKNQILPRRENQPTVTMVYEQRNKTKFLKVYSERTWWIFTQLGYNIFQVTSYDRPIRNALGRLTVCVCRIPLRLTAATHHTNSSHHSARCPKSYEYALM